MSVNLNTIQSVVISGGSNETSKIQKISGLLTKEFHLFGNEFSDKKKERFYSELNILLSSGIDLKSGLEIIVEEQNADNDKILFESLKTDVIDGFSFSDAIKKSNKFSIYEYYSLKIGEESGRMKDVMSDLSIFFSKKIKQRRQLTSALTYPILVIVTAFFAVFFMLNFIVPMFMDVFKRFNGEMPALTKTIISISVFFKSYILLMVVVFFLFIGAILAVRKTTIFRAYSSKFAMKIPMFGDIVKKVYLSRYCQSMALLLGAKTPMLRSLDLVKLMIGFYPFEKALEIMQDDILHGKLLNQSMAQFEFFDARIVSLVRVAEEVNQMEVIFAKLNNQYNDELEHRIGMLSSLLEPIMIIIVGLLVAVILISMYLPLFQLSSSIY